MSPVNETWIRISAEDAILREISDYFTFDIPGAAFMRRNAKFKGWSGKIHLFRLKDCRLGRGLVPRVIEFADARGYSIDSEVPTSSPILPDSALDNWITTLQLPYILRDYQYEALRHALDVQRGVVVSVTSSGKSLVIYLIQAAINKKTLLIVPNLSLLGQAVVDFQSYGCDEDIHCIQAGAEKNDDARIFISTWQSIFTMPASYFEKFDVVMVDEVHLAKAAGLSGLLEKCTQVHFRFGFTGTINETQCHRLQIESMLGSVRHFNTTRELVKAKQVSPLLIKFLVLQYPELLRKHVRHLSYQEEIDFLVNENSRTAFIVRLAKSLKGLTLILFGRLEHGKSIYDKLVKMGLNAHYVAGNVTGQEREAIRQDMNITTDNTILVGSFGVASTGINIPGLANLIFASPSKSSIRVLQSAGRILRLAENKQHATIYDIVDDLRIKRHSNFAWRHGQARSNIYATEHFPVTITQLSLEAFSLQHPVPVAPPDLTTSSGCDELSATAG